MVGRTAIDLEPYKAQVISWFQDDNITATEIAEAINTLYNVVVVPCIVQR
jgi:hypothetical protein